MQTAHQYVDGLLPEFSSNEYNGAWATDLGSLDAPDLISAGASERAMAYSYDGYYPLPIVIRREAK